MDLNVNHELTATPFRGSDFLHTPELGKELTSPPKTALGKNGQESDTLLRSEPLRSHLPSPSAQVSLKRAKIQWSDSEFLSGKKVMASPSKASDNLASNAQPKANHLQETDSDQVVQHHFSVSLQGRPTLADTMLNERIRSVRTLGDTSSGGIGEHSLNTAPSSRNVQRLEKEKNRLEREVERLTSKNQELREINVQHVQDLRSLRAEENRNHQDEEKRARVRERQLERIVEKLTSERDSAQRERSEIAERHHIDKDKANQAIGKWKETLEQERQRLAELKHVNAALHQHLEEEHDRLEKNSRENESRMKELSEEISRLTLLLESSHENVINEKDERIKTQSTLDSARKQLKERETELQKDKRHIQESAEEAQRLSESLHNLQHEHDKLKMSLTDSETLVTERTQTINDMEVKLGKLRSDLDKQIRLRWSVEEQTAKYKLSNQSQYDKLCEQNSENNSLKSQIEDLEHQLHLLEGRREQEASLAKQEINDFTLRIEDLSETLSKLEVDMHETQRMLQREQKEHTNTRNYLENSQEQLERTITELSETQVVLQGERDEHVQFSRAWREEKNGLTADLEATRRDLQQETLAFQTIQDELGKGREELHAKNEALTKLQVVHESLLSSSEIRGKQLTESEKSNSSLKTQLQTLATENDDLRVRLEATMKDKSLIEVKLEQCEQSLLQSNEENLSAKEDLHGQLLDALASLNQSKIDLSHLSLELGKEKRDAQETIADLRDTVQEHLARIQTMTTELHNERLHSGKLGTAHETHISQLDALKDRYSEEQRINDNLRQDLLRKENDLERFTREQIHTQELQASSKDQYESRIGELEEQVNASRNEIRNVTSISEDLRRKLISAEEENLHLQERAENTTFEYRSEVERLVQKNDSLEKTNDEHNVALHEARTMIEAIKSERALLEDHLQEHVSENHDLASRIQELRGEVRLLLEQIEATKNEGTSALNNQASEYFSSSEAQKRLVHSLQNTLSDVNSQYESERLSRNALLSQLKNLEEEVEKRELSYRSVENITLTKLTSLQEELSVMDEKCQQQEAERKELESQKLYFHEECERLRIDMKNIHREVQEEHENHLINQKALHGAQSASSKLEARIESLKINLHDTEEENKALREKLHDIKKQNEQSETPSPGTQEKHATQEKYERLKNDFKQLLDDKEAILSKYRAERDAFECSKKNFEDILKVHTSNCEKWEKKYELLRTKATNMKTDAVNFRKGITLALQQERSDHLWCRDEIHKCHAALRTMWSHLGSNFRVDLRGRSQRPVLRKTHDSYRQVSTDEKSLSFQAFC